MFVVVALVAPVVQAAASKAANCVYCYSAVTFLLLLLLLPFVTLFFKYDDEFMSRRNQ